MKNAVYWATGCLVFTIPVSPVLSSRILLVAVGLHLIDKESRGRVSRFFFRNAWDLVFFFSILMIGVIYSEDITTGMKVLETSSSLIGVGIVGSSSRLFDKHGQNQLLKFFTAGVVVASLICLVNATVTYFKINDFSSFSFYRLTSVIDSHPTYFAYYLIAAITFCLFVLYYDQPPFSRSITYLILLVLFLTLNLTGGTTAYFSVILVFSFFVLKSFVDPLNTSQKLVILMVVFGISTLMIFNLTGYDFGNDQWERFELWKSAIYANPNPLLGVGTGDYKDVLNRYYVNHGMGQFATESYNAHNQYVQIYFSNGILGLVTIALILARPLYLCFVQANTLGVLLVFPFLIYGITEVFLGRYQGVVFFALLHQIFITSYFSRSKVSVADALLPKNLIDK